MGLSAMPTAGQSGWMEQQPSRQGISRNREKSLQMAESLGISPDRCYEDYQTMARLRGNVRTALTL